MKNAYLLALISAVSFTLPTISTAHSMKRLELIQPSSPMDAVNIHIFERCAALLDLMTYQSMRAGLIEAAKISNTRATLSEKAARALADAKGYPSQAVVSDIAEMQLIYIKDMNEYSLKNGNTLDDDSRSDLAICYSITD